MFDEAAGRAEDVLAGQRRQRVLLRAYAAVAGELSSQEVLRHVVTAARELAGARYAAIGVLGERDLLVEFVHVGMDSGTVERIGALPVGRGVLGLPTSQPSPVRLTDLRTHLDAAGFPPGHPIMDSFLGVPIRVRDRLFGNLYLAGSANGAFSDEDERLVVTLAVVAGLAIDNAHLRQESERRHLWLTVSARVTRHFFAGDAERPVDLIPCCAQEGAAADFAALTLFTETGQLQVHAASGRFARQLSGRIVDVDTSVTGQVTRTGAPVLSPAPIDLSAEGLALAVGSAIVVPLMAGDNVVGTLSVGRLQEQGSFTRTDLEHLSGFAAHAGVTMELDRARADQEDLRVSDDHDRIGLDLTEHVIEKLYAVGLGLQGMLTSTTRPLFRDRIMEYIAILDATINGIRDTVYGIVPDRPDPDGWRQRLLDAIDDGTSALGFPVTTTFTGTLNIAIRARQANDVVAVAQAALSAIAHATHAELHVNIAPDAITVEAISDGTVAMRTAVLASPRHGTEDHAGPLAPRAPPEGRTRLAGAESTAAAPDRATPIGETTSRVGPPSPADSAGS